MSSVYLNPVIATMQSESGAVDELILRPNRHRNERLPPTYLSPKKRWRAVRPLIQSAKVGAWLPSDTGGCRQNTSVFESSTAGRR